MPSPLRAEATRDKSLAAEIGDYERAFGYAHSAGSMPLRTLLRIERLLTGTEIFSAETGCGKSTIFFSRIAERHKVFCFDDRGQKASSVDYFMNCPATRSDRLDLVFGPTQLTLPRHDDHSRYDLVLIDGPHGFPFPELEYYYFYPHLKTDGLLVVDDIHIPTISRLADFLSEDQMFEKVEFVGSTAIFRRTDAPVFDPLGDGWWLQAFNRRRASFSKDIYLEDGKKRAPISFEGIY
ncbi:class I SAM-dependent methyltransferase [Methylocystis sp. H62]|jgi:predicted O-methyltransferase YrrM|uniref:class I SAM-dependent methyltransferase n=1 Tax=Methylocystis sp. H62 TaxID=2785789 RepID=UPI0018C245AC|nr:class I SAM-dependent methyltransferase [Methylocystis sp. H62]MBG0793840.1 class I SAM-dependent methyltransferase [Methylocystis sp. H62]